MSDSQDKVDSIKNPEFLSDQVQGANYFFLDLYPSPDDAVCVVCGGRESCSPNYRIERDSFRYYSLEYVAAGHGTLTVGGKKYPLRPGMVYSYGPDVPHVIETDPENPMTKYFVDFVGSRAVGLIGAGPLAGHEPRFTSTSGRIRRIYEDLIESGNADTHHSRDICTVLLELLILRVCENAIPYDEAISPAWDSYQRCLHFIDNRYVTIQSLDELAKACNIDKSYLCRLFRRYRSESPYQYLLRLKMNRAADLMLAGNMLVKEAADQVGFADPYHFSRVFKKIYGASPENFLRAARRHSD